MNSYDKTHALMQRGRDFLGTEHAILCGAMSWVSERNLVSAISNAGGFGVIACGAMTPDLLDTEITETKARTDKPFGVNLITMHPDLNDLIAICAKHEVTHVVLAGGIPPKGSVEAIKDFGAKVIVFAPTLALAKKLLRSGGDALVIEGMEAGGHIGPVSTSVLAQEFLPVLAEDHLVFVAGGIGRGEAIAGYLEMGAVGVQLGTRFACATESIAHENFKKAFFRANARDAVASVQVDARLPVIPVRALKNNGTQEFTDKQREIAGSSRPRGSRHGGSAIAGRTLLGRRPAPRRDRWRCGKWQPDGRPVGRHGQGGGAGGRHHGRPDGRMRSGAGAAVSCRAPAAYRIERGEQFHVRSR